MSDTFIDVDKLEWQTVKIHRQGETSNYNYEIELFKPLADWDVWDYWERERIDSMREHIKPGEVLFDVGAEQGWMSALFSKYLTDNIVLVEPTAEFWPGIKAIYEKNKLKPPIASFVGFFNFRTGEGKYEAHEVQGWPIESEVSDVIEKRKYRNIWDCEDTVIPNMSIDEMKTKPDHISIDVEGAELQVLLGAEQTLRKHKPLVWCSVHPGMMERDYNHSREDLLFFMDAQDYEAELLAVDHEEHWFFTPKEI